jgi:glycosyltransferase involved in cell wall biosynthesis
MYNEAAMVRPFVARIVAIMTALHEPFELVLVNDGSTDATLAVLHGLARADARLRVIDLSRNFGKEAALSAALDHAEGDAVVFIDADLQDPPELLAEMLRLWRQGHAVVQVRRVERSSDSWLKRCSARAFYRVHNWLAHDPLPPDVGDFRWIDRQVADALRRLPERQRFMKGLFNWVDFNTVTIDCVRGPRMAGEGKFSGWRLWNLALEAITSFSTLPLRVWTYIGATVAACACELGVVWAECQAVWPCSGCVLCRAFGFFGLGFGLLVDGMALMVAC